MTSELLRLATPYSNQNSKLPENIKKCILNIQAYKLTGWTYECLTRVPAQLYMFNASFQKLNAYCGKTPLHSKLSIFHLYLLAPREFYRNECDDYIILIHTYTNQPSQTERSKIPLRKTTSLPATKAAAVRPFPIMKLCVPFLLRS